MAYIPFLNNAYFSAKVGIGTDSPSNLLDVVGSNAEIVINDTNSSPKLRLRENGSTSAFIQTYLGNLDLVSSGDLNLYSNNTLRVTVKETSGNVGIGTTSPGDKLSIAGNLSTLHTGYATKALRVTMNSNDTLLSLYARADQSNQQVLLRTNGNSYLNGGNVGIGTTSPNDKLHISDGSFRVQSSTSVGRGVKINTNGEIDQTSSNSDWLHLQRSHDGLVAIGASSTAKLYVKNDVGIGTTSPSTKLSVLGTSGTGIIQHIEGSSSYGATTRYSRGGSYTWQVGVGGNATGNDIPFSSFGIVEGSAARFVIGVGGNVGIGTLSPNSSVKLQVEETGSNAYIRIVETGNTGLDVGQETNGNGIINLRDNKDLRLFTNGTEAVRIKNTGNVGIGTTSPEVGLHLSGTGLPATFSITDTAITNASYDTMRFYAATQNKFAIGVGSGASYPANIVIDGPSGNVGIGTTSPSEKLEVAGDINLYNPSNTSQINFRDISNSNYIKSNGYATHFGLRGNAGNGQFIIENNLDTNQDVRIKPTTGGWTIGTRGVAGVNALLEIDTVLNIYNKTSVGIGTTTPSEKLEVNGNVKATRVISNTLRDTNNNGHLVTTILNASNTDTAVGNAATANNLSLNVKASGNVTVPNGNVGIGTTNPNYKLEVAGKSYLSGGIQLNSGDEIDFGNSQQYITGVNDTSLTLATGGSATLTALDNGNVGIGTTSPAYPLDIQSSSTVALRLNNSSNSSCTIKTDNTYLSLQSAGYILASNPILAYQGLWFLNNKFIRSQESDGTWTDIFGLDSSNVLKVGTLGNVSSGGDVAFLVSGSEKMRVAANGNVGIGTTAPGEKLTVVGKALLNNGSSLYVDSAATQTVFANIANIPMRFQTNSANRLTIGGAGAIQFNNYNSTNNTGTPTYLLGTDASGNVVKTLSTPSPITSQAASLYDLIPNGAFTTTYAFTSTAGTYAEVMSGDDVITAAGTYSVQMYVSDYLVGGTQYREYYSGVMSWSAPDSTNDTGIGAVSEIVLHRAGHAANEGITYLRTRETGSTENNELRLEIMCNKTYTGASNVVFKFVRLI